MFLDGLRHVLFICSGFLLVGSDRVGGEGKKELVLRYILKVENRGAAKLSHKGQQVLLLKQTK